MNVGDCVLTKVGEAVRIDRADPVILIGAELLTAIELGYGDQGCELRDGVLELRGINRTVRYRIGDYSVRDHRYVGELIDP